MKASGKGSEKLPRQKGKNISSGEPAAARGTGQPTPSRKNKPSNASQNREYRKKKQDALTGRDAKKYRSEESDSRGKGRSSGDKAKSGGSGPQSRDTLQVQSIQFSSGGGAGGNLASSFSSLLSLFASSASLARADGGAILTGSSQTANLSLRSNFQLSADQTSSFLNQEGKGIKGIVDTAAEKITDTGIGLKFSLDASAGQTVLRSGNGQDPFTSLLKNINVYTAETASDQSDTAPLNLVLTTGFSYFQNLVNTSSLFFNNQVKFTFANSPADSGNLVSLKPYENIISPFFIDLGLPTSSTYTYRVISPTSGSQASLFNNGITVNPAVPGTGSSNAASGYPLSVDLSTPDLSGNSPVSGLTLNAKGDLFVNVDRPISVLLEVNQGNISLPVRINAGPGNPITSKGPGIVVGDREGTGTNGQPDHFVSSVITSTDNNLIAGNALNLISLEPGIFNYGSLSKNYGDFLAGSPVTTSNFIMNVAADPNAYNFTLPGNVIYRHVGTSAETVPISGTYGNFAFGSIIKLPAYSVDGFIPYHIHMGGNVLDVFGTKYGTGDNLSLITGFSFLSNAPAGLPNVITMGGNTLAGFGTSYGDLQSLTVGKEFSGAAIPAPPFNAYVPPTSITFNSNLLYVDKAVGSILYPHLQELRLVSGASDTHVTFSNSIIHGNAGSDTFYGDIQNLEQTPFSKGVTAGITSDGHITVTTATDNNTITWGNNIYTGGNTGQPGVSDTYNFTLLGDANNKPIMQGNALVTDFNLAKDTLNFQVTVDLFKSLDLNHDKSLSADELDAGVNFIKAVSGTPTTVGNIFPQFVSGTTLAFTGKGTLSLQDKTVDSFTDFANLKTVVGITYQDVSAKSVNPQPLIYGQGPGPGVSSYYNELDNFFNNSLLARYSISSSYGDSLPGVEIDRYGSITVTGENPLLLPVTLTATASDQLSSKSSSATSTLMFGFLNAPLQSGSGATIIGNQSSSSHILESTSSSGSTIYGNGISLAIESTSGTDKPATNDIYGSNLIVSRNTVALSPTQMGSTAYGNYHDININVEGVFKGQDPSHGFSAISGDTLTFKSNAFSVTGTTYGVADDLNLMVQGGNVNLLNVSDGATVNAFGNYAGNTVTFGTQTAYGYGTIYGQMDAFNITVSGGDINTDVAKSPVSGSIDISGNVKGNTFIFDATSITIHDPGDHTQGSTVYGNLNSLSITLNPQFEKVASPLLSFATSATFTNNHFIFGQATLTGGAGNTSFYGHLQTFGDPNVYTAYDGFSSGVRVENVNTGGSLPILKIIDDQNNNSITWGNNTYTGGQGNNNYNFTIVKDINGYGVMQGYDTVTNFNVSQDKLVFNLESSLYNALDTNNDNVISLSEFNKIVSFNYNFNGQTLDIDFTGKGSSPFLYAPNGAIYLKNISPDNLNQFPASIQINKFGADYQPFSIKANAPFDPVFTSLAPNTAYAEGKALTQPAAFASFIVNANPLKLTYTATGLPLDKSIQLSTDGTLTVNVKGPVDYFLNVTITDGTTTQSLSGLHIFALNTTDGTIIRSSDLSYGNRDAQAYETNTPGNTIIGGGADIIGANIVPDPNTGIISTVTYGSKLIYDISSGAGGHTAIGDVRNINFTNIGGNDLTGRSITFGPNLFNVDARGGEGIFGNSQTLNLNAASGKVDQNSFTFGDNKIYGSGNIYGNMSGLNLTLDNSTTVNAGNDPLNNSIKENVFNFGNNTLINDTQAGEGYGNAKNLSLTLSNSITVNADATAGNNSLSSNQFNFGNNSLTGGNNLYGNLENLSLELNNSVSVESGGTAGNNTLGSNIFTFGNNTLTGNTQTYGNMANLTLTLTNSVLLAENGIPGLEAITGNTFIFGNNTLTGSGILYGNLNNLSLVFNNPAHNPGESFISGNKFMFGSNNLHGGSDPTTLYSGINTLNLAPSQAASNIFTFKDSTLTAGSGVTAFYGDIADLSNTLFVKGSVLLDNDNNHVVIQDAQENRITWGNDQFYGNSISAGNSYNFTLLNLASPQTVAIMQGNAELHNFDPAKDTLNLKLAPLLFKGVDTNFDRSVTATDLNAILLPFNHSGGNTTITFFDQGGRNSQAGGSLKFDNLLLNSLNDLPNLNLTLAYTPAPITIKEGASLQPAIFNYTHGIYGNALDNFFNNIDISNQGSTYTVSSAITGINLPAELAFNPADTGSSLPGFNQYGTLLPSSTLDPVLSLVNIHLNDVHFTGNTVNLPLFVGIFNGGTAVEPELGGDFNGSLAITGGQLYQGTFENQIIRGNGIDLTLTDGHNYSSYNPANYGENSFGDNMIINTKGNVTAYGDFQTIHFDIHGTMSDGDFLATFTPLTLGSHSYDFGSNAFLVNGTVYGVASSLTFDVDGAKGLDSHYYVDESNEFFVALGDSSAAFHDSQLTFGNQTIYGSGTIYGDLGNLDIHLTASNVPFIASATKPEAGFYNNTFQFGANQIVILGNNPGTVYTGMDQFKVTFSSVEGTPYNEAIEYHDNKFIFSDSRVVINGSGASNVYLDINDLSTTSFWQSGVMAQEDSSGHITLTDGSNNSITWGNNSVYLGGGQDTIHLNAFLNDQDTITVQGNTTFYNFDKNNDVIDFKLSQPLYNSLDKNYNRNVSRSEFAAQATSLYQNSDTLIRFNGTDNGGSVKFDNLNLAGLQGVSNINIGSAFVPAPITVKATLPVQPFIFSNSYINTSNNINGDKAGLYGFFLDQYFNNIDFSSQQSTYTVTRGIEAIPLPSQFMVNSSDVLSNNFGFNQFGTFYASNTQAPVLSLVTVTPNNVYNKGVESLNLYLGIFNGATAVEPGTGAFQGSPSMTGGQLYQGTLGNQVIRGNGETLTITSAYATGTYGQNSFGSNMIINTKGNTTAYGDFQTINFDIHGSATGNNNFTPILVQGKTYDFGSNAFLVDGSVYGIADILAFHIDGTSGAGFSNNIINFGNQTIYGSGTVYGDLNTLNINLTGSSTAFNATFTDNIIKFGASQIVISGNTPSTVYTGLNEFEIQFSSVSGPGDSGAIEFKNNQFIFSNSTTVANGYGATDIYPDINDLSKTAFSQDYITSSGINNHVVITDGSNNSITWGNNSIYLGAGTDTVHLNVFGTADHSLILQGNTTIHNFDPASDKIDLKLSRPAYQSIDTNFDRILSQDEIKAAFAFVKNGSQSVLDFGSTGGSIVLDNSDDSAFHDFSYDNLSVSLAYTVAPVTAKASIPAEPVIFNSAHGTYGFVLDQFFNNLDVASQSSGYIILDALSGISTPPELTSRINAPGFNGYGTFSPSTTADPLLAYINVYPFDVHYNSNISHATLLVGLFNGATAVEPGTGSFTGSPAMTAGQLYQGTQQDETIAGNGLSLTIDGLKDYSTPAQAQYGGNRFGGNMIINTHGNTAAYGDYQTINFDIHGQTDNGSVFTPTNFVNNMYDFGKNAFDVNGIIHGIAETLSFDINGTEGLPAPIPNFNIYPAAGNDSAAFSGNTLNFGSQTIYGSGIIYGDLNNLNIELTASNVPLATGYDNARAIFSNNTFQFGQNQIGILGNNTSIIYSGINNLEVSYASPANSSYSGAIDFSNNHFIFADSVVSIQGSGSSDIYPGINDLSSTSFYQNILPNVSVSTDNHVTISDSNSNSITWGNESIHLGTGQDTIHLNLFQSQADDFTLALQGNITLYNYNPGMDIIDLNLSKPLYNLLADYDGPFAASTLEYSGTNGINIYHTGTDTVFKFGQVDSNGNSYGSLVFKDVNLTSLGSLGNNIHLGTTFDGTAGDDTFNLRIPTNTDNDFASFTQFDHIVDFDTAHDSLQFTLSKTLYDQISQNETLTGNDLTNAFQTAANIHIVEHTAQYTPTAANSANIDSILEFFNNGSTVPFASLTLHNIDLNGQLNQLGTHINITHT